MSKRQFNLVDKIGLLFGIVHLDLMKDISSKNHVLDAIQYRNQLHKYPRLVQRDYSI